MNAVEVLKKEAGISACNYVKNGMKIGLGTGSTVKYTIIELGRRIVEENLEIIGVPTSEDTQKLAKSLGIPLSNLSEIDRLDLTIDGADEFDNNYDLIKGGGGALTREKIVALASNAMIVVADDRKKVSTLGQFPLPVEVHISNWENVKEHIEKLCTNEVSLRYDSEEPFVTDNGGYILDCNFGPIISDPYTLENKIKTIEGVVEVGLFVGICDLVIISSTSGVNILTKQNGRLS
ncbi:MAG: ribose 5-phosphate isomerase A [Marine Group II euryarchaeote MED-G38]|nr:MAG: ribose 5-phosphate isomerase A [Marine Group II euryarchaeote MED-G38]|tara:strand:- start:199 stop:903 length:705 start_codon:yes stop_codon:yes gene_type:complete